MAKKIRLDFSKTEERSGWNTRSIPEGLHKAKIVSVQETEAGDGTAMLVYALAPTDSRYKSRLFPFYCKLQQNQYWKLRDLAVAAGMTIPKKAVNFDPDAPVGKTIAIEVEDETGQYAGRSQVQATYGLDILDEDGDAANDDSDDEEYEDEEDEAEEADDEEEYEDEEDEEDDEEEEEDLSTLTITELRKRAKELGIDHSGVKKADLIDLILEEEEAEEEDEDELDDDDLEDEDLEDEEFEDDEEDEEEEPEPAPRRRAASAKAKAPAKAATAKRTVKRR